MQAPSEAKMLRIFVGESARSGQQPLYKAIVLKARDFGFVGATVLRGPMGFGHSHHLHTQNILELSGDLPLVVENAFLPELDGMMTKGFVVVADVRTLRYGGQPLCYSSWLPREQVQAMNAIEILKTEWPFFTQAPLLSITFCTTFLGIGFVVSQWLSRRKISLARGECDALQKQLAYETVGKARVEIAISKPKTNATVPLKAFVTGVIDPPGHPVQVLIFSGDGMWHPQTALTPEGREWGQECWFGNANTSPGRDFTIIAVDGMTPFVNPAPNLPERLAKSQAVKVRRS